MIASVAVPKTSTPRKETISTVRLLVVDDNPVDRRLATALVERKLGWRVLPAANGREALAIIEKEAPDLVLTDLLMEEMDGLTLVETVRTKNPTLPIILMTAHGSEDLAFQALRSGAANYVPKRRLAEDLTDTLEQVLAAWKGGSQDLRLRKGLTELESLYILESDPALVRSLVFQVQEDLTRLQLLERSRVRVGVALEKAMLNGIYHGNLEISFGERLKGHGVLQRLVEQRRQLPAYRDRNLSVRIQLSRTKATFVIGHEGPRIDLAAVPDPACPASLSVSNVTGMLLVQTFMDEVTYNPEGNQITLTKHSEHVSD